jgi:hypothetical protein
MSDTGREDHDLGGVLLDLDAKAATSRIAVRTREGPTLDGIRIG